MREFSDFEGRRTELQEMRGQKIATSDGPHHCPSALDALWTSIDPWVEQFTVIDCVVILVSAIIRLSCVRFSQ